MIIIEAGCGPRQCQKFILSLQLNRHKTKLKLEKLSNMSEANYEGKVHFNRFQLFAG